MADASCLGDFLEIYMGDKGNTSGCSSEGKENGKAKITKIPIFDGEN